MFARKAKLHNPTLRKSRRNWRQILELVLPKLPQLMLRLVEISNGGVVNNLLLDDQRFNRPIARSCQITMLGNYYFAIVGHYDNPVFEMEFNPPMKTMDSSQSRDQSYKVRLRLGNQKSISTKFLHSHLPPLLFNVIIKNCSV